MRFRYCYTVFLMLCLLINSIGVVAQEDTPEIVTLKQFFTSASIDSSWFANSFLAQVPVAQLLPARQQITTGLGDFLTIETEPGGQNYRAVFDKGYVPVSINLDKQGKINGLFLRPPVPMSSSLQDAAKSIASLGGEIALLVTKNGETLQAINVGAPLAVGSAFKLSILAALMAEIDAGNRRWQDIYQLREGDRSLPTGTLRTWPEGAPLTLYDLAARMISESDNTATDALLHALGRSTVEAHAPARNRPFMTTREAFALKNPDNEAQTELFLTGGLATRRTVLENAVDLTLPGVELFASGVSVRPEIEWFYSVTELCAVMKKVASAEITQINNGGIASAEIWKTIAYKGGSEPGVLNQTFWLTDMQGNQYCVAATRNDQTPFDQSSLIGPVNALISLLAE